MKESNLPRVPSKNSVRFGGRVVSKIVDAITRSIKAVPPLSIIQSATSANLYWSGANDCQVELAQLTSNVPLSGTRFFPAKLIRKEGGSEWVPTIDILVHIFRFQDHPNRCLAYRINFDEGRDVYLINTYPYFESGFLAKKVGVEEDGKMVLAGDDADQMLVKRIGVHDNMPLYIGGRKDLQ